MAYHQIVHPPGNQVPWHLGRNAPHNGRGLHLSFCIDYDVQVVGSSVRPPMHFSRAQLSIKFFTHGRRVAVRRSSRRKHTIGSFVVPLLLPVGVQDPACFYVLRNRRPSNDDCLFLSLSIFYLYFTRFVFYFLFVCVWMNSLSMAGRAERLT